MVAGFASEDGNDISSPAANGMRRSSSMESFGQALRKSTMESIGPYSLRKSTSMGSFNASNATSPQSTDTEPVGTRMESIGSAKVTVLQSADSTAAARPSGGSPRGGAFTKADL
jgi:hypothetical protein